MSLGACIPGLVKEGKIDPQRGKRMAALFDELEGHYRQSMGPAAAAAEASEATLRQLAGEARLKRRQTLLQINAQREALKDIGKFRVNNKYKAIGALLDDDDRAPYRGGNVTTNAKRIDFEAHGRISQFIDRHRRNLMGKPRDRETLDNVAREMHGQATGDDAAKTMADAIGETFEQLRQRFNAAGGNIRKLAGFGMPHRHDALKVRAVSAEQWISEVLPELDRAAMIDDRTGVAFTDQALNDVLADVYQTIRTNGLTGDPSAAYRGGGKLANRRTEHRFMHFKDGDAWLRYNAKYGQASDPFTAIVGHIEGMAKEIAMMERLGPNPDATMRYLMDEADLTNAASGNKFEAVVTGKPVSRWNTEALWKYVKGESSIPVVRETAFGRAIVATSQGARNFGVATKLGSAVVSASSDVFTGVMARHMYGMPATKSLGHFVKAFNPRSANDKALARRIGAGLEHSAQTMRSTVRLFGESDGPGWTQVLADGTLRTSGLNLWTEKGQDLFVTDFLGFLGDSRDRKWDDLPAQLRRQMEANGLDQFDWTAIRQAPPIRTEAGTYIDPAAILDRKSSDRLMNMVLRGRAAAVQESSATSRVVSNFGLQGGTVGGEVWRNSFQFKGFAVALALKQYRMMSIMSPAQRGAYAASFVVGMTMFGALTIQLREIIKGRDPRPMDDEEFWADALLQGGGIGIAGDLIGVFSDDRIYNRLGQFLGGPSISMAVDAVDGVRKALPKERSDGSIREGDPGAAAVRFAKRNLPGSNIWYSRLAFERIIVDTLDEMASNDVQLSRSRELDRVTKNRQDFWWQPGDGIDQARAPDVTNALGGESPP